MLLKEEKTAVIEANKTHENDTGSPEVQIAILNSSYCRINRAFKRKPQRSSFKTWSS